MIRLRFAFHFLILLTSTVATAAVTTGEDKPKPWYQVELIIFAQPQPTVESSEQWDNGSEKRIPINYKDSIELSYPANAFSDNKQQQQPSNKVLSYRQSERIIAEGIQRRKQLESAEEAATELQPFTFTPVTEWVLGDQFERLNRSGQYKMLVHTAWIQPGLDKNKAISIHIHDHMELVNGSADKTKNSNKVVSPSATSSAATSYPLESSSAFKQGYSKQPIGKEALEKDNDESKSTQITFNGTLKVILARYLHVELNLDYAPQGFPQGHVNATNELAHENSTYIVSGDSLSSVANNLDSFYETSDLQRVLENGETVQQLVYHLQQSRRMRSKTLHYIDHPKIGVLIKILPVEIIQKDKGIEQNSGESVEKITLQ